MRRSVLLASSCLPVLLSAQPVLQYGNADLPGSAYDLYLVVDPGQSDFALDGPDADWDFTTAQIDLVGAATFMLPQSTPHAADYPAADVALQFIYGSDISYSYYDLTASGLDILAAGIGGTGEQVYWDPSTLLQFPFSYGEQFTDDHTVNGSPASVVRTYSGYGALQLVTGITDNAVKVSGSNGQVSFYRSDPVEPVLTIGQNNTHLVWERITIGMAEQRRPGAMTLAPNPATSFFRIPRLEGTASYRVTDAMGRVVLSGRVTGVEERIDVSVLHPGVYHVHARDDRGERTATLLKD